MRCTEGRGITVGGLRVKQVEEEVRERRKKRARARGRDGGAN